ncbi:MAG: hypothetical protein K2V38_10815, partial [Gemmataceae bacterium]|nr:hypothetical protein [Gemmataceae bacterium]
MRAYPFVVTAAVVTAATPVQAGLLVEETFTYTTAANAGPTTLHGKAGGTGFAGAWTSNLGSVVDGEYQVGGNNFDAATRKLASAITGDVYFGFDFRFLGHLDVNDFASLWFDDGTSTGDHTAVPNVGLKAQRGNGAGEEDAFIRLSGVGGTFHPTRLVEGETYRIVGKLSKVAAKDNPGLAYYNAMQLWVDPAAEADFSVGTVGAKPKLASISRIGIRTANLDVNRWTKARDSVAFDNLKIGDSFGDVSHGFTAAAVP